MSEYNVADFGPCTNTKVYGLDESIIRSKYPKAVDTSVLNDDVTKGILALAQSDMGEGHDNFLNGIIVQFDLTYTIKAWTEAERYHFFDFISSQSTMHKIAEFDIDKQCCKYVTPATIAEVNRLKDIYNANPTVENYLYLLYNVPVGFKLTAGMTTNYRQLKTMRNQRPTHRIPEWRLFCKWIDTLPHSEFITGKTPKKISDVSLDDI
jgi:hypothetical protein